MTTHRTLSRALLTGVGALALATPFAAFAAAPAVVAPSEATETDPADHDSTQAAKGQANDEQSLTTSDIVVTGSKAAQGTPITSSLKTTQPQSVIGRALIDNALPVSSDFTALTVLTPGVSLSGNTNGPGLSETKIQIRGFQDGEFNVTYDSIPFSDTNSPQHRSTAFFPSNTIETVVVDRGPGNASQLGQATYGGNVNLYSRAVAPEFGIEGDLTYGSFNTVVARGQVQTGKLASLGNAAFVFSGSYLRSDGALTNEPTWSHNLFGKAVIPLGNSNTLTVLATYNRLTYFQSDTGTGVCGNPTGENCTPGSTIGIYGKNYGLTNDPNQTAKYAQSYYLYNRTDRKTDFEIARLQSDLGSGFTLDNRVYMYAYTNHTLSGQDATGRTQDANAAAGRPFNTVILTSGGAQVQGVPGYTNLSKYRNYGYIGQINYDFSRGRIRLGGWYEKSKSSRNIFDIELVTGAPNYRESALVLPSGIAQPRNVSYDQDSGWRQYQVFGEFEFRPIDGLSITPGVKYMSFTRETNARVQQTIRTPQISEVTFKKTLPFLTANLALNEHWSAYFQFAKGLLVPPVNTFYLAPGALAATISSLKPQTSQNFQLGTVYHGRHLTFDADIYAITVNDKIVANPNGDGSRVNIGQVKYKGGEAQVTYTFDNGVTLLANGSIADAFNVSTGAQISKSPGGTAVAGVFYQHGRVIASFTEKYTGRQFASEYNGLDTGRLYRIGGYAIGDFAVNYKFDRFRIGVNVSNVFNNRDIISIGTSGNAAPGTPAITKTIVPNLPGVTTASPVQFAYGPYDTVQFNPPRSVQVNLRVSF